MGGIVDAIFGSNDPPPAPDYAGAASVSGEHAVEVAEIQQTTAREQIASAERIAAAATATQVEALEAARDLETRNIAMGERGITLQEEGLAFQKSQYADWESVYGSLQENIGDYYQQLGPDKIMSQGLQATQAAFQKHQAQLQKTFEQRGLTGSGIEAAAETSLAGQQAIAEAGIRAGAEEQAMTQKQQFLGLGLGQGSAMLGTIAQQQGTAGQAFQTAGAQALQAGVAVQGAYGGIAGAQLSGGQLVQQGYGALGTAQGQQMAGHFGTQQSYISGGASIYGAQAGYQGGGGFGDLLGTLGGAYAGSAKGSAQIASMFAN